MDDYDPGTLALAYTLGTKHPNLAALLRSLLQAGESREKILSAVEETAPKDSLTYNLCEAYVLTWSPEAKP